MLFNDDEEALHAPDNADKDPQNPFDQYRGGAPKYHMASFLDLAYLQDVYRLRSTCII